MAAHDSVGALAEGSGAAANVTPAIPNTTSGVFGMLIVSARVTSATFDINGNDGSWTQLYYNAVTTAFTVAVYYRRLTGGDSDPVVNHGTTGSLQAYVICATDIVGSGSPLDVAVTSDEGQSTQGTAPDATTTTNGALVYRLFYGRLEQAWSNLSAGTEIASGASYVTSGDGEGSFGAGHATQATAGSVGTVTMDLAGSIIWHAATVALTPSAGGGAVNLVPNIVQNYRNMGYLGG